MSEIKKNIIFHVTLTPYKRNIEPNVKDKKLVIEDIKESSKILGKDTEKDYIIIGENFSKSAKENNIKVQTCFEEEDLTQYEFNKGECLSHEPAYVLTVKKFKNWTARKGAKCKCVQMFDIGSYITCNHTCKYRYDNLNEEEVLNNIRNHDENSSLLVGVLNNDEEIKVGK